MPELDRIAVPGRTEANRARGQVLGLCCFQLWRRGCFFRFAVIGVNPPGHGDADQIETEHGDSIDAHGPWIWTWANECGNQKDDEDGVTNVLPEKAGADDSKQRKKEDEDGHFEADTQAEDDGKEKAG